MRTDNFFNFENPVSESRLSFKGFSLGSDSASISKSKFDRSLIRSVMVGQVMQWLFVSNGTFTGLLWTKNR